MAKPSPQADSLAERTGVPGDGGGAVMFTKAWSLQCHPPPSLLLLVQLLSDSLNTITENKKSQKY